MRLACWSNPLLDVVAKVRQTRQPHRKQRAAKLEERVKVRPRGNLFSLERDHGYPRFPQQ